LTYLDQGYELHRSVWLIEVKSWMFSV